MNDLVLSAYQVLKALSEREALSEYRKVGVSYADVWPGQLVFSVSQSDGEVKNCLIPVWQIRISKKAWEKALGTEKESETLYLTLNGNKVFCPSEGVFKQAEAGTVFRYTDGRSYMLQECDSLHRKVFVPEPKYAIGLKKSPILEVCER